MVLANFKSWFLTPVLGENIFVWEMTFLVVVWVVWRYINKIVFHGDKFDEWLSRIK